MPTITVRKSIMKKPGTPVPGMLGKRNRAQALEELIGGASGGNISNCSPSRQDFGNCSPDGKIHSNSDESL